MRIAREAEQEGAARASAGLKRELFKASWERMVCLAALHEVSEIGTEERIPWHADNPYAGLYDAADEVASSVYDQAWLEHGR